jgi:hypothetical protein
VAATGWLIRHRLQRRWVALVPLALIVMLGSTGALVAAGAADRTASAYSRYLDRADVGDVVINPSLSTTEIDEVIRGLPGVRSVTRDALFVASLDDGARRTVSESIDDGADIQVRGSVDGRYTRMDRPAITEGRFPTGPSEALVSAELADARDVEIGDELPLSLWRPADELLLDPETVVSPLAVEHPTVVGIATFADEVLPDGVYPRQRVVVSPDVAARYDCLPDVPSANVTLEEAVAALLPEGCATSYPYYSLEVDGGSRGVAAALTALISRSADLSAELPQAVLDDNAFYSAIATTTAQEQQRVERSTQPTVAALSVLGAVAAAITLIVLGLVVARELRRSEVDQRQWWHLGLTRPDRVLVVLIPLVVAVTAGLVAALLLAWALSPVAPVGLVGSIDPSPARELSSWGGLGALALGATFATGAAVLAYRAARRVRGFPVRRRDLSSVRRLVRGSARPEIDVGIRAAYGRNRGAGLVVASGAVAVALFLAATVFSNSLSAVLSTPASYGWPWDVGLMGGAGYGEVDVEAASTELDSRDDVESWTGLGFTSSITVDGEPVLSVVGLDQASDVDVTVVEGRLPAGERQVALGSRTAADLGVGVGDDVELGGDEIAPRATVTGIVVLPALGPVLADRTGPGTGMLLPASALGEDASAQLLSFIGVDLARDADVRSFLADIQADYPSWEPFGDPALEFAAPVRPPEIINAESMRGVPLLIGGLLMATAVVGLVVAVVVSVRSRRRELAILRALGFTGRQLRDSVRVQTVATMAGALVVGVPLGIVVGRVAWRAFAAELGVVTDPSMPGLWIVGAVVGALVVTVVAAVVPARVAARTHPADVLRSE